MSTIRQQAINTIRGLSLDQINAANSGHPGLPLGAAPMAYALWANVLNHNPQNPSYANRDRFVLSAGHGSALLYSLLHTFGYPMTKEDLMRFRQLNSNTPGHPEYGHTVGVEASSGALGQGFANAVGMALAETVLANKFNTDKFNIVDHRTYVLVGDGCMMEGIQSEAASLAGALKLNKLVAIYDSNNITIEGNTDLTFTEDVAARHRAQGWDVITVDDGNDVDQITAALLLASKSQQKPTLVIVKTVIGFGSELQGTAAVHGSPLTGDKLAHTKAALGIKTQPFEMSKEVVEHFKEIGVKLAAYEEEYKKLFKQYKREHPELADEYQKWMANKPLDAAALNELCFQATNQATRVSGGTVINKLAKLMPNLIGGSADLAPSTKSDIVDGGSFSAQNRSGRNIHFGIREHAMAAICNGMYLHGGLNVYCSGFFVFSDYMKYAIRMSALTNIPVTYILTHDSIGVGEDGPTHQPVEQLAGLRSMPNLKVFRPCDANETAAAYYSAFSGNQPTCIILSRQNLAQQQSSAENALRGGYVLVDCPSEIPDIIYIATGSEVDIAVKAAQVLTEQGLNVRVVSMPCIELFEKQTQKYKESVLPSACRARVAIEAASPMCWHKYAGLDGAVIGVESFGMSAPADKLFEIYGFSVENAVDVASKVYKKIAAEQKKLVSSIIKNSQNS